MAGVEDAFRVELNDGRRCGGREEKREWEEVKQQILGSTRWTRRAAILGRPRARS